MMHPTRLHHEATLGGIFPCKVGQSSTTMNSVFWGVRQVVLNPLSRTLRPWRAHQMDRVQVRFVGKP